MESKKIEESASRSHVEAHAPTPGQTEKARAFCDAWPSADPDPAIPEWSRDRAVARDCAQALAQLLADETHERDRLLDDCRESLDLARAEGEALRWLLRLAGGALSDVVQLARSHRVRSALDGIAASPLVQIEMLAGARAAAGTAEPRLGGPAIVRCAWCGRSEEATANAPAFPGWPVPWGWTLIRPPGRPKADPDAFCERCSSLEDAPPAAPRVAVGFATMLERGFAERSQAERVYRAALGVEIPEESCRLGLPEGKRETIVERINRLARERDQARTEADQARSGATEAVARAVRSLRRIVDEGVSRSHARAIALEELKKLVEGP